MLKIQLHVFIFCIIFNISFSQTSFNVNDIKFSKNLFFDKNNDIIENGVLFEDIKGKRYTIGEILNNKKNGLWVEYFPNGRNKMKGTFFDGDSIEKFSWYNSMGLIIKEREFLNNSIIQKLYFYYYDNSLERVEERLNGLKNGFWNYWYINGIKQKVVVSSIPLCPPVHKISP